MSIRTARLKQIINEEVQLFLKEQDSGSLYGRGLRAALKREQDDLGAPIRKLEKRLKELEEMGASSHAKNPLKRKLKTLGKKWRRLQAKIIDIDKKKEEEDKTFKAKRTKKYLTRAEADERERKRTAGATGGGFPTSGWTGTGQEWVTTKRGADHPEKFGTGVGKDWKAKPGATGCPKGYYWDSGLESCEKDIVAGVSTKAQKKRKGRKGRGRRKARSSWRRTYPKGVKPAGIGFKSFESFYDALDKAGIKIKKDKHWGPSHWRKWKKLKKMKLVPGGVSVTDKILKRAKDITTVDPKTGKPKGATVGGVSQKILEPTYRVEKPGDVKAAQADIAKRSKAGQDERLSQMLALEKKAMANLKMAEKAAEAIPQVNVDAKLKAVAKVERLQKMLDTVRKRMQRVERTGN